MKLVISNIEVSKRDSDLFSSLSPDMTTFREKAKRQIGANLKVWLKDAGITEANAWEKLGVSTLELRSWENGSVSPLATRFFQVTKKLGHDVSCEALFLVNALGVEGQMILRMAARSVR